MHQNTIGANFITLSHQDVIGKFVDHNYRCGALAHADRRMKIPIIVVSGRENEVRRKLVAGIQHMGPDGWPGQRPRPGVPKNAPALCGAGIIIELPPTYYLRVVDDDQDGRGTRGGRFSPSEALVRPYAAVHPGATVRPGATDRPDSDVSPDIPVRRGELPETPLLLPKCDEEKIAETLDAVRVGHLDWPFDNSRLLRLISASLGWFRDVFGDGLASEVVHVDEEIPHIHLLVTGKAFASGPDGPSGYLGERSLPGYIAAFHKHMGGLGIRVPRICQIPARRVPDQKHGYYGRVNEAFFPKRIEAVKERLGVGGGPDFLDGPPPFSSPGSEKESFSDLVEERLKPVSQAFAGLAGEYLRLQIALDSLKNAFYLTYDHPAVTAPNPGLLFTELLNVPLFRPGPRPRQPQGWEATLPGGRVIVGSDDSQAWEDSACGVRGVGLAELAAHVQGFPLDQARLVIPALADELGRARAAASASLRKLSVNAPAIPVPKPDHRRFPKALGALSLATSLPHGFLLGLMDRGLIYPDDGARVVFPGHGGRGHYAWSSREFMRTELALLLESRRKRALKDVSARAPANAATRAPASAATGVPNDAATGVPTDAPAGDPTKSAADVRVADSGGRNHSFSPASGQAGEEDVGSPQRSETAVPPAPASFGDPGDERRDISSTSFFLPPDAETSPGWGIYFIDEGSPEVIVASHPLEAIVLGALFPETSVLAVSENPCLEEIKDFVEGRLVFLTGIMELRHPNSSNRETIPYARLGEKRHGFWSETFQRAAADPAIKAGLSRQGAVLDFKIRETILEATVKPSKRPRPAQTVSGALVSNDAARTVSGPSSTVSPAISAGPASSGSSSSPAGHASHGISGSPSSPSCHGIPGSPSSPSGHGIPGSPFSLAIPGSPSVIFGPSSTTRPAGPGGPSVPSVPAVPSGPPASSGPSGLKTMNSPGAKKRAAADDQPTQEDNLHNLQSLFPEGPGPLFGAAPTTVIQRGGRGSEEVDGVKTETSGGVMTETSGGVKTETPREVGFQDDRKKETERTWPTLRPK